MASILFENGIVRTGGPGAQPSPAHLPRGGDEQGERRASWTNTGSPGGGRAHRASMICTYLCSESNHTPLTTEDDSVCRYLLAAS